jgi:hypothetical protein
MYALFEPRQRLLKKVSRRSKRGSPPFRIRPKHPKNALPTA